VSWRYLIDILEIFDGSNGVILMGVLVIFDGCPGDFYGCPEEF